ncbi:MAG: MOSC domain-containing protein [Methylococcales bacterium]|nr:MOSC domain-containing protein [Methylococcales bacterium]
MVLSDIYIYPVKSLAGIRVENWEVVETGLKYDRQWMLIDEQGQFLSQRRLPKMALIQTRLTESELILSAPNFADLHLSLEPKDGAIISSTVWKDCCDARHVSNEADAWFREVLQIPCTLVYLPPETKRGVDLNYALEADRVAFSDGFPFLIISENSLNSLNSQLENPVEMARFRPNLVISGCEAYAEDFWREIQIGNIDFRLPKPCSRCSVPAINPNTAEVGKEPLTTLNRLRKANGKIYFGQNALHNSCGELNVDDAVLVKQRGESNLIFNSVQVS